MESSNEKEKMLFLLLVFFFFLSIMVNTNPIKINRTHVQLFADQQREMKYRSNSAPHSNACTTLDIFKIDLIFYVCLGTLSSIQNTLEWLFCLLTLNLCVCLILSYCCLACNYDVACMSAAVLKNFTFILEINS